MVIDFETEKSLLQVLCDACIWKERGECNGGALCETYQYVESKNS